MNPAELLHPVFDIALEAGRRIMAVYRSADFGVTHKDDASPLTQADLAAHRCIVEALARLTPDTPILSEEAADIGFDVRSRWSRYWLVDPLDGTKEFIKRNGDFTVNIALIENGIPVLGVVHLPAYDDTYIATRAGVFAQYGGTGKAIQISCRTPPKDGLSAVASKNHMTEETETYLAGLPIKECINAGSSLKFCRVAEGRADVYPRFGPTMEWDTAAGHAVLMYAGGEVITENGRPLLYGKPEFRNPNFIARGPGVPDPA